MKSFKDTRAERRASSENTNTSRMSFKETKAKRTGVPYTPKTSIKSETKTATVPAATQRAKSTHSPSQDGYRRRQTNVPAEQSFFYKIGDIFDEKIKQAEKAKKQRDAQDEIVRDFFVSSAFKPYDEASADPFAAYKVKQAGRSYGGYINATHSAGELLREADDILSSTDYRGVYDSAEEDARSKRNAAYGKMSIEELEELKNKRDGFVSESGRNVSDFVNDVIDYAAVPSSAADAKEEKRNYIISSAGMYGTDADTVKRVLDRVDQGVDPYEAENIIASALGGNSDSENNVIDAFIRQKRAAAKDDEWEEADRKYAARAKAAWNNSGKAAKISLPGTGKLGGEWEEPEIEKKNSGYSDYIINSLSKKTLEKIKGNHAPEIRSVDDAVAQAYFKLTEPDYIFISLGNSISTERFANLDELNDRELATLVTIYNEDGADAADEYLSHMKYATDKRITERMYGNMEEFAGDHPFAASVLSVPMNTLGGVTGLSAQISALFGADVSQYDMSLLLSNASNKAREVVSEDMSGVGSFFYQTGMSMADCIFNMAVAYALTPGAGSNITEGMSPFEKIKAGVRDAGTTMNLIMSSSAASSTFSEKLSEGYTTSEAALLAGLSGFAEYITEKVSIETYLKSKGWLQSILSSMAAEGSEEFNSDVINSVGAKLLVGESEIEKQTAELMASGMSEKEAFNKAFTDWWAQAGLDALGGAISGLGFSFLSGGRIALEKADAVRNARKYTVPAAKDIIAQGGRAIDYAVDEGLKYGPDTSAGRYAALLAAQSEESGKYASRRQITRLLTKEITDASPRVEIDTQVRKNYDGSAPVFSRNDNGGALVRLGDRYVGKDEISFANLDPAVREVYAEAVTMTDENGRFDAERANKYAQLYDGSDPAEYRRVFNAAEEAGENGVTFAATEDLIGETDVSPRAALEAWAYGQKINSETSSTAEAVPLPQKGRQETPSSVTADTATPSPEGKAAKVQQNITKAQQNVPGITSSTAETVPLPQRGRQEVTPTVRLTRLADGTIAVTTDKGVVTTRQTIKLDDLSPEMQKPYAVAVTMKDADGNIDIDKANAYLAGYDGSPVNEYTAKFEKEYANAEIASSVTADAATPSPEGNAAKTQQNITKTQQNVAAGANETENLPSGVNESVDGVNENVNVNNEKTPAAERASRATFDDFEHRRVIKRQNGSVTDQSGTLTKDDLFVIGAVADKFGLDINILNKMDDGSWGEFVRIMHQINLSSKSDLFSSFMHELGHVIEFWAPEKFAGIKYGFRDFIIQKYGMRTMSDLLDDVKARYGNISDDAALVELACDQLEVVRDVESFAEEVAENLSKAGYTQSKIRQFLRDIADFLKRAADVIRSWAKGNDGKGGAKTAAGVYAERDAAYCKQLAEKFLDAADTAAENYKAHANGESAGAEADGKVKKMIANTKNMSWDRQISGFLGKKGILKRSDSLVLNKFTDNIVSENNLPNIIPVAVLSKSKSGKDMSHSLNDETLRTLEKDINNWSIAIKEASRKTVSYIFDSESEILPVFATFRQDSEFDRDKGNIARSIHLRTDVVSTIKALDGDSVVYIKKHKSSTSSRSLPQPETLTTKAKLVYIDDNTSSVKSQEKEENDAKYLSAVKSGDMETAQRMVEEAAKAAGYTADESWKMDHRAPNSDDDTAHSMDDINGAYGGDDSIYDKRAAYYYGEGRSYDGQAISVIRSARNNPDKPIKVYRAVPTDIKDTRMRNGDWVAIVKDYAEEHGDRVLDGDFRIIENTVPAKHLYNNGDSINEWGYDNGNRDEVYKNTENNVKLQTVTYDDEGNIIPLSERFNEGNSDIRYMRPQEQSEVDELRSQLETERAERADYEKKTKAVIREQKKMIRMLKESAATGGKHIVSFESTQDVIRRLNGQYGTRLSLSDDASELTKLYSKIANIGNASSDDVIDLLRGFAKKVIDNSYHKDTSFRDEHKGILSDWRKNAIRLNRDQVSVLEHKYGSWTEARKHFFGKINFSQTGGTYLDDNFREWLTEYPELFPGYDENLTAGDQPLALLNAYDLTRPETVSELMDGFGGNTELAENYLAAELFDAYWNVDSVKTVAKARSEAIGETEARYEKAMREYKTATERRVEMLEKENANMRRQLEEEQAAREEHYEREAKATIRAQKALIEALKSSMTTNGDVIISNESTKNVIRDLNSRFGARLSLTYDTPALTKIFSRIANSRNISSDDALGLLRDFANKVVESSYQRDRTMRVEYKDLLRDWRENPILLNEEQIDALVERYGSWSAARKNFFGKINFSKTEGVSLEENYQKWVNSYPELFPNTAEYASSWERPSVLLEAYGRTQAIDYSKLVDEFGGDAVLAESVIANELFDAYWNVDSVKTVAKARSEAIGETEARYEKAMRKYKTAAERRVKMLEGKIADIEGRFENFRERDKKEKLRKKIKDQMKWFQKRALSPNGQAHVPNEMYDALIAVCDAVDLTHNYDTQLGRKIALLKEKYAEIRNAGGRNGEALSANAAKYGMTPEELYDLKEEFDEGIEGELERLGKLFEDKSVFELKTDELSELYDVLETIKERFKHAGEILGDAENRTFAQSRQNFEEQQRKFVRIPRKLTRFMQDVTSPLRAVRYLSDYNADGELVKYFDALEQGTFKSSKYKMDMMKPFDDLRTGKNKAEYDRFAHDLVDGGMVDEYGKPVMLTHADIVSIIMTAERERASGGYTAHLQEGGITIPDRQLMKDGKPEKAKARSQRVRHVTTENIASLAEMLTDYDRKWIAASENLFNNVSPKILNDVMLAIKYKRFIQTGYYIPFITDSNFLVGDIDALKFDARLKEAGYMKEVTKGANAPLMLLGIDDLVNRHVDNVSTQGGLAVPLYNLNRFYNGPVGDTSIKRIVQTAFGEGGHGAGAKNIIEQVMTDLQKNRGGDRTWVDSLVSNYVSAVLTFNPSVTIKQMASYEAAGVYLSQRALGERFSMFGKSAVRFKKICDEIDKHTGLHYMRRIGLSSAEIAQMTEHYGVIDKGLDKLHLPEGINPKKWIQFTDCLTTAALWEATKKQVGINYAAMDKRGETHAEVGSDEYWNDVIALYERVISDTQPMYDVLHRPEFSKKDNKLFKVMNMFKTVPFQNLGILADAAGEYSAMRNAEGEVLKNAKATEQEKEQARQNAKTAKKKLGRAVMSQAFGVISFALMTAAVALGLHREDDYRDEYGDLTFESVLNGYAWNLAEGLWSNTLPFLPANGVNLVRNNFKFDAISETPAGEIVNELITDLTKGYNQITDVFADKTMPLKEKINTAFGRNSYFLRFVTTAGDTAGFPAANTKKLTESIYNIITDPTYIGGERKKKQLFQKLYDGRIEGDKKKAGDAYSAARKQYNNADIDTGIAALLMENPTIESMAKAYADGDWDSYDKDYDKLYAMGFSDVQILKARNKYINSLEPDEEYDLEKESTDVVEVSYERAAQAVADGDIETIERAVRDYADKGKSDSSIKSGIRNVIKPIYATSDEKKRKEIRETLIEYFGFTDKTHWDEWENPYTYDDLYSAITSGAGDEAAKMFNVLASYAKSTDDAREELAGKLREVYVKMNGTERADMHDFLKKYCGFPSNYNFGAWLNRNYK